MPEQGSPNTLTLLSIVHVFFDWHLSTTIFQTLVAAQLLLDDRPHVVKS